MVTATIGFSGVVVGLGIPYEDQALIGTLDPTQLDTFTGHCARLLNVVCDQPLLVASIVGRRPGSMLWAYGRFGVGTIIFVRRPPIHTGIRIGARKVSAEALNRLVLEAEVEILSKPGIRFINTRTTLPGVSGGDLRTSTDGIGSLFLELYPESEPTLKGNHIIREARELRRQPRRDTALFKGRPLGTSNQVELSQ